MSSQLADRLWAAIGTRPKQEGVNVVQAGLATWRTQSSGSMSSRLGYLYTSLFGAALVGFLACPGNFAEAAKWNDWIESLKVLWNGASFLDFCGSAMTCFAFRRSHEQAIERNDRKLTCTFLQFGGTTTTALFLGQNASWTAGTHVFSAFMVAWWLTFCAPLDLWYRAMQSPFLFIPVKIGQTVSSAHAVSSWGVEKALAAEHERMRNSVWGALACGYFSSCFGWVLVEFFLAGGAGLQANCPTFAMQRGYYMVLLYYSLIDPHGVLRLPRQAAATYLTPLSPVLGEVLGAGPVGKSEAKVVVLVAMLIILFGQDFGGVDLLVLLNKGMGAIAAVVAPINMRTTPPEPEDASKPLSTAQDKIAPAVAGEKKKKEPKKEK